MKAYLSDFVITVNQPLGGLVYRMDHSFKDETDEWFKLQVPALDPKVKAETWYSILCEGGGAIYVPESKILQVEGMRIIHNPWFSFYFRNKSQYIPFQQCTKVIFYDDNTLKPNNNEKHQSQIRDYPK